MKLFPSGSQKISNIAITANYITVSGFFMPATNLFVPDPHFGDP
jgi:hypothetical protein